MEKSKTGKIKISEDSQRSIEYILNQPIKLCHSNVPKGHDSDFVCCHIADIFRAGNQDYP